MIHPLNLNVAVTALHVLEKDGVLFAGIGGTVEIYSVEHGSLLQTLHVMSGTSDSVHGFRPLSEDSILVFGGKSLACITRTSECFQVSSPKHVFADWVFDVAMQSDTTVLAITAHNTVLKVDLETHAEESLRCYDENCILYSACLVQDRDDTIVIGGTVFKEVILWSCTKNQGKLYHRLSGHEGVIFSVQYSEELSLICSTSDDRSARLWIVEKSVHDWGMRSISPFHILGSNVHTSRVFRCRFSSKTVMTGGEDSILAAWDCDTGECRWKRVVNDGSPVWSIAESSSYVFSGGGNASIKRLSLLEDALVTRQIELAVKNDAPKLVKYINASKTFVALTQKGRLHYVENDYSLVRSFAQEPQLENYAVMEVNDDIVYLGTLGGKLMWAKSSDAKLQETLMFDGKIFALTILKPSNRLLVCGKEGKMKLALHSEDGCSIVTISELQLPPPVREQPWFSCACEIVHSKLIIVGDRCGNIHIYGHDGQLQQSLLKAHGKHGVASVQIMDPCRFMTTGRDGFLKVFAFDDDKLGFTMETCRHFKIDWLERCHENGDTILGFLGSKFVVHSISDGVSIAQVECGGGHRSWDFNGDDLVFIKDKKLMLTENVLSKSSSKQIRPSLHNREINCVSHFELEGLDFLITGSEDTMIKAWSLINNDLIFIQSLRCHISSVKSIDICDEHPMHKNVKIMVTSGGRAQVKLWLLSLYQGSSLKVSELGSHLLKGNDKQRQKSWKHHDLIDDVETRYLSLTARFCQASNLLKLIAACSDGVIRILGFDFLSKKVALLRETSVLSHAVLKVGFIKDILLTASTNGNITLWNDDLTPQGEITGVNQSGVNAVCIYDDDTVISGGDDGSITIASIKENKIKSQKLQCHAAHVTGLCKVDPCHVVSCSIDQRITLWKVVNSELTFKSQCFTHVSNIQAMTSWKDKIAVVGDGVQIIST